MDQVEKQSVIKRAGPNRDRNRFAVILSVLLLLALGGCSVHVAVLNIHPRNTIIQYYQPTGVFGLVVWHHGMERRFEVATHNGEVLRDASGDFVIDGAFESWYSNGQPKKRFSKKNGVTFGSYYTWYDNGQMWSHQTYSDAGVPLEGWAWRRDGSLENYVIGDARNGDGLFEFYYIDGSLKERGRWKDLMWQGEYESYYRNGAPRAKGVYDQDKKIGLWKYWDEQGLMTEVEE